MRAHLEAKHVLPGRVRFHWPPLSHNPFLAKAITEKIRVWGGISKIEANHRTGNVLILYDTKYWTYSRLQKAMAEQLRRPLPLISEGKSYSPSTPDNYLQTNVITSGMVLAYLGYRELAKRKGPWHNTTASIATLIAGYPLFASATKEFVETKRLNNDFLISMATLISLLSGEGLTGLMVIWLINLSTLIQQKTLAKSEEAIRDMLLGRARQYKVIREGQEIELPQDQIKVGEIVIMRQGDQVPVDGAIKKGQGTLNMSSLTGEALPILKTKGDQVLAGSMVTRGYFLVEASKVGEDTSLAKIVQLIENSKEAPIQKTADYYAAKIIPLSFVLALGVFALTRDIYRSLSMLIVACPCATGLATPTALAAAMGNGAKKGILFKSGQHLEAVSQVSTVLFDKTGTLTQGRTKVNSIHSLHPAYQERDLLEIAASLEKHANHPLAEAILNKAREERIMLKKVQHQRTYLGKGIQGVINGKAYCIGNPQFVKEQRIDFSHTSHLAQNFLEKGHTVVYLASGSGLLGFIALSDPLKAKSYQAIKALKEIGINNIGLVTGDNKTSAGSVAHALGIHSVYSEMLPQDKAQLVQQATAAGHKVGVVGEGVNDSPALAHAHVGFAMGIKGTDAAIAAADVILKRDDPVGVAEAILLSRKTIQVIQNSFKIAIGINLLGIVLSTLRLVSPLTAAILHNASTFGVVINSMTLLHYSPDLKATKIKNPPQEILFPQQEETDCPKMLANVSSK